MKCSITKGNFNQKVYYAMSVHVVAIYCLNQQLPNHAIYHSCKACNKHYDMSFPNAKLLRSMAMQNHHLGHPN